MAYVASFFIVSEAVSLVGVPSHIDEQVTMHTGDTYDRLFLLSSVSSDDRKAVFYTVNDTNEFILKPNSTIEVEPASDFNGTVHVDSIAGSEVTLDFDLHRDKTVNVVIGIAAVFLLIGFYVLYTKIWRHFEITPSGSGAEDDVSKPGW